MTSKEANALSNGSKAECKKSATIGKLMDISCRIGEKADFAKMDDYCNNSFSSVHNSAFCVSIAKMLVMMAIIEIMVGIQK